MSLQLSVALILPIIARSGHLCLFHVTDVFGVYNIISQMQGY